MTVVDVPSIDRRPVTDAGRATGEPDVRAGAPPGGARERAMGAGFAEYLSMGAAVPRVSMGPRRRARLDGAPAPGASADRPGARRAVPRVGPPRPAAPGVSRRTRR